MTGLAPYDNHTENIDSHKIEITRCFFVLNMSGFIELKLSIKWNGNGYTWTRNHVFCRI